MRSPIVVTMGLPLLWILCSSLLTVEQAMYERFTDRSRKVMQLANEEAMRFNHEYIGTEHILLGLVAEGAGRRGQRAQEPRHRSPQDPT